MSYSVPGSVEIAEYGCTVSGSGSGSNSGSTTSGSSSGACSNDSCENPLYAIDHQDTCGSLTVVSLRLEPENARVPAGRKCLIRTVAVFSDGQEANVTTEASYAVEDEDIAEHVDDGVFLGHEVGVIWVEAVWRGVSTRGTLTVFDGTCVNAQPWDVVIVIDNAIGCYLLPNSPQMSYSTIPGAYTKVPHRYWYRPGQNIRSIDLFDDQVIALQLAMSLKNTFEPTDPGNDRVAIVNTGDGLPYVHTAWTDTMVVSGIDVSAPLADCKLGVAFQKAQQLFAAGRADARKLMVVYTHGAESSCAPPARSVAYALQAAGVEVAIITPVSTASDARSVCSYPQRVFENLEDMASPCLFFGDVQWNMATSYLAQVLGFACGCNYSGSGLGLTLL